MAHLQHVDRMEQASCRQERLDGRFRVAGQQRTEAPVAQERDDRGVVDVPVRQGTGNVIRSRKEDLELRSGSKRNQLARSSRP